MSNNLFQNLSSPPVPGGFPGRSKYYIQFWYVVSATLFRLSPHFMYGWRRFLLRLFGASIGKGVKIRPSVTINYPWNISIGNCSYIGDEVVLYSLAKINIGAHVSISYRVFLCTGTHDYRNKNYALIVNPILIEDEVWLATDVFVAPGVSIGSGSVVGARCNVFKSLDSNGVYSGNPLKYLRPRIGLGEDLIN